MPTQPEIDGGLRTSSEASSMRAGNNGLVCRGLAQLLLYLSSKSVRIRFAKPFRSRVVSSTWPDVVPAAQNESTKKSATRGKDLPSTASILLEAVLATMTRERCSEDGWTGDGCTRWQTSSIDARIFTRRSDKMWTIASPPGPRVSSNAKKHRRADERDRDLARTSEIAISADQPQVIFLTVD